MSPQFRGLALLGALMIFHGASAQEVEDLPLTGLEWAVGVGGEMVDNIERDPSGGRDETVGNVSVQASYLGIAPRHSERIFAAATYLDYFQDVYSEEIVRAIAGVGVLKLVPELFHWNVEENYGPIAVDPLEVDTPENRGYANFFSTGPTISLGSGRRTRVVFDARYGRTAYDATFDDASSDQFWGDVGLVRQVSPKTAWSLHAAARDVEFDKSQFDGYDTSQGYLRFEGGSARTEIQADAGVSRLDYLGRKTSEPLIRLSLSRRLTPITSFGVNLGSEFADPVDRFRREQDVSGVPELSDVDLAAEPAPLQEDFADLTLEVDGSRTELTLGVSFGKEEFQVASPSGDRKSRDVYLDVTRSITDAVALSFFGLFEQQDYTTVNRDDDETFLRAAITWRVGRRTTLVAGYSYGEQESTDNTKDYQTSTIGLSIYVSPSGRVLTPFSF
jgi:hypothetical protein